MKPVGAGTAHGVASQNEHFHHVRLSNRFFHAMYVEIPAHQKTEPHRHAGNIAFVAIGDAHVQAGVVDAPMKERTLANGDVMFIEAPKGPHVLENLSDQPFKNITIEMIQSLEGTPLPKPDELPGRALLAENGDARFWRLTVAPGETVLLPQTDAPGVLTAVDEASVKSGGKSHRLAPGGMVFHAPGSDATLINVGAKPVELRYVERIFKRPDAVADAFGAQASPQPQEPAMTPNTTATPDALWGHK